MGSMGDNSPSGSNPPKPWIETPLIYSAAFSKAAGCNIYLKLENIQPSGSFKSRGIGTYMYRALASATSSSEHPTPVHFFNSSGGNAGLACATAARTLNCPATIVVPTTTNADTVAKLRGLGAEVIQKGDNWAGADGYLRDVVMQGCAKDVRGVYVPPFDHPDIWDGASTLADELFAQLPRIDGVVLSVGGGGLLCGMMAGLERERGRGGAASTKVLAVETEGAASLGASIVAGKLVALPAITSVATSLGASQVAARAFEWAVEGGAVEGKRGKRQTLFHCAISDRDAVAGCARLLDEERILVEPACGVTVAAAYDGILRMNLGGEGVSDEEWKERNVVLVMCGGSTVKLKTLNELMERFGVKV